MAKCTFYVQIEPEFSPYRGPDGELRVTRIRAKRITQKQPYDTLNSSVVVKLTVEIPDAAFKPLRPEAIIQVPADFVAVPQVTVTADDPEGQAS